MNIMKTNSSHMKVKLSKFKQWNKLQSSNNKTESRLMNGNNEASRKCAELWNIKMKHPNLDFNTVKVEKQECNTNIFRQRKEN